jgi:hypothetical protein
MSELKDLARFFAEEAPRLRRFLRRFGPSISAEDIAQPLLGADLDIGDRWCVATHRR